MADILSLLSNQKRLYSGENNMAERPNKKLCLGDGNYLLAPQAGCDAATPSVNDLLNVALAELRRSKSVASFSASQVPPHYEPKTTSYINKDATMNLQAMNHVAQDFEKHKKTNEQALSVSAMFPPNNIRLVSAETSMSSSSSTRNAGTTSTTTSDLLVNALANQMTEEAINMEVERMILRHHIRRRQSFEQLKAHQQKEAAVAAAAAAAAANFRPPSMTRSSSFTDDSSLAAVLKLLTSGLMQSVPPANPSTQMMNALLLASQGA